MEEQSDTGIHPPLPAQKDFLVNTINATVNGRCVKGVCVELLVRPDEAIVFMKKHIQK